MDKVEILRRLRNYIDEASEDFYADDADLYKALTEAQKELYYTVATTYREQLNLSSTKAIPLTIQPLTFTDAGSLGTGVSIIAVSDMIVPYSMTWYPAGVQSGFLGKACKYINATQAEEIMRNSLLSDGYYYWIRQDDVIEINPPSVHATAGYTFRYFKELAGDIDASTDPELDSVSHDAIVERACWILLKDRESDQAQLHLQLYAQLLQGLVK